MYEKAIVTFGSPETTASNELFDYGWSNRTHSPLEHTSVLPW